MAEETPDLNPISLESVYADPQARLSLRGREAEHRALVRQALAPREPIYAYWWDPDFTGLVLVTDRHLLQFPQFRTRKNLFRWETTFDTWRYPYDAIQDIRIVPGSFFEYTRIVLQRAQEDDALIVITRTRLSQADRERLRGFVDTIAWLVQRWQSDPELRESARWASARAAADSLGGDLTGRLRELYELYQSGALSEAEYQQAKKKLLEG